jgi:hypothetical protein
LSFYLKPESKMHQKRESAVFGAQVLPSGFRLFAYVYTITGKRRQMNLGNRLNSTCTSKAGSAPATPDPGLT